MAKYSNGVSKGAANVQSVGVLLAAAATPRRVKVYDWSFGSNATPADVMFEHIAQRCTTTATGAAVTLRPTDPADTESETVLTDTVTVDPTLTAGAIMLRKPVHARSTFRWVAAPYGELVIPATASNGFMFGLFAATTTTMSADLGFEEQ